MSIRELFGGAMSAYIPDGFVDVSDIRHVPNNQEVYADAATDQSIVVEILELVAEATGEDGARYHFNSIAYDNEAEETSTIHQITRLPPTDLPNMPPEIEAYAIVGQQQVTKFREKGSSARNLVTIFVGLLRIPQYETDLVVSLNVPVLIGATSSSRATAQEGNVHVGMKEFKRVMASLTIRDWSLFAGEIDGEEGLALVAD